MRFRVSWQFSVLLVAAMTAGAQAVNSSPPPESPAAPDAQTTTSTGSGDAATNPEMVKPGITVTGTKPRAELPLPKIPPDQFANCLAMNPGGSETWDMTGLSLCEMQLAVDERIVIGKCTNRDGKSEPAVMLQACNELLDRDMLHGHDRFYLLVDRALAYVAMGDTPHALDDYDTAVKLAPKKAQPYYYRGIFHASQTDVDAAVRDFDTALALNPQFVPALLQRARVRVTRRDFSGALADYSEAIRLQPKAATAWSERGQVSLLQTDYENAIKDEAQAIQLDPKLARAWFLRGAAYGDLGDSHHAANDVTTAVGLDPFLARYITMKGKTATLALPPL